MYFLGTLNSIAVARCSTYWYSEHTE